MSLSPSQTPCNSPEPLPAGSWEVAERRLRICLLALFFSAAFWLVAGSIFSLIASIKFHGPGFLAGSDWLTYGRVRAAATTLILYGFCVPGGLGVALWILARSGRTALLLYPGILLGIGLLNVGVGVALGGILSGDLTGFESFELPGYAAIFIFLGYLLIGAAAVLTLHARKHHGLSIAQWYLLAAIFWFPWIFSTAGLLLLVWPARGVGQSVVAWWYGANLQFVWLTLTGLAVVFHLIQREQFKGFPSGTTGEAAAGKVAGPYGFDPGRYLALFAFWMLVLFGSWTGVPPTAPVPAWMPAISTVATVLSSVFFIAVILAVWTNTEVRAALEQSPFRGFVKFAVAALVISGAIAILPYVFGRSEWVTFTWMAWAKWQFAIYGFFGIALFAGVYASLSEFSGNPDRLPPVARPQFWLAASGTLLIGLSLAGAGVIHGIKMRNPEIAFVDVSKATLHFLRLSTVGDLLILAANVLLLVSVLSYIARSCRASARSAVADALAEVTK